MSVVIATPEEWQYSSNILLQFHLWKNLQNLTIKFMIGSCDVVKYAAANARISSHFE